MKWFIGKKNDYIFHIIDQNKVSKGAVVNWESHFLNVGLLKLQRQSLKVLEI